MKYLKIHFKRILAVLIVLLTVFSVANTYQSFADATVYSDVLSDLSADRSFTIEDFPKVPGDYSLKVVTIAESVDKELFVYVYQPSGFFLANASSINLGTVKDEPETIDVYQLEYINSYKTLFKYRVKDFIVSESDERYYFITGIYRRFNTALGDQQPGNGNTITEVVYDVSKEYVFEGSGDNVTVNSSDVETVKVTDKFVGRVRYEDTYQLFEINFKDVDSHFVAFSTDHRIDKLYEAKLYFTEQKISYTNPLLQSTYEYENKVSKTMELTADSKRYVEVDNGNAFTWKRIETVSDFITRVNSAEATVYRGVFVKIISKSKINDLASSELSSKEWVLSFYETIHETMVLPSFTYYKDTIVGDVSILRLKFETEGKVYNLGVIDNRQTGSQSPINDWSPSIRFGFIWPYLIYIIAGVGFAFILKYAFKIILSIKDSDSNVISKILFSLLVIFGTALLGELLLWGVSELVNLII